MTTALPETPNLRDAEHRLDGHVQTTPVVRAQGLFLKLEHVQATRSFKERGALNALLAHDRRALRGGVLTASAGNHAQGLAFHARRLEIAATVVMPATTPAVKVERVRALGARVHLHGDRFCDAYTFARALQTTTGAHFIHPYDDADVIAGQATATIEFLRAVPDLDVLLVPVGGGGLIAGAALAIRFLGARVRLVGVRHAAYPSVLDAPGVAQPYQQTLAEGLAVETIGVLPRAILRGALDDVILISEAQIQRAVGTLAREECIIAEGAGAAGLAAFQVARERYAGQHVGTFVSGGNIDDTALEACLR